jgi:cold shock protein
VCIGKVKWFNQQKRNGFIQHEGVGGGQDVIVHISAVQQAGLSELRQGQLVFFDMETYWKTGKPVATSLKTV